jgi:hypothetical protein
VWETLTNEDATYRQRKSFQYVAGGQNGVQQAGSNPARSIETNARIHRAERKEVTRMSEQVIHAFLAGFAIGVSSYLSFIVGTAIASYFARKDLRGNENE